MGGAECQWFDSDFGRFHEYTTPGLVNHTKVKRPLSSHLPCVIL